MQRAERDYKPVRGKYLIKIITIRYEIALVVRGLVIAYSIVAL